MAPTTTAAKTCANVSDGSPAVHSMIYEQRSSTRAAGATSRWRPRTRARRWARRATALLAVGGYDAASDQVFARCRPVQVPPHWVPLPYCTRRCGARTRRRCRSGLVLLRATSPRKKVGTSGRVGHPQQHHRRQGLEAHGPPEARPQAVGQEKRRAQEARRAQARDDEEAQGRAGRDAVRYWRGVRHLNSVTRPASRRRRRRGNNRSLAGTQTGVKVKTTRRRDPRAPPRSARAAAPSLRKVTCRPGRTRRRAVPGVGLRRRVVEGCGAEFDLRWRAAGAPAPQRRRHVAQRLVRRVLEGQRPPQEPRPERTRNFVWSLRRSIPAGRDGPAEARRRGQLFV